jgi:hypothetical protein
MAAPVAGVLLFASLAALVLGGSREPGLTMLLLCAAAVILAAAGALLLMWAVAYRRLGYALTESALRIEWLGRTLVVPYVAIQGVYAGQRLSGNATPSVPHWPGINVGPRRVRGLGRLHYFATSSDQSQLTFITVEHGGVIISPGSPNDFQTALIQRVEHFDEAAPESEDTTWQLKEPSEAPWTAVADVWLPICLGFGMLVLLLILATINLRYDSLPDQVPLHFDVGGQPSQMSARSDLLRLPLLALVCLVLNWIVGVAVHPREKVLARLLWLVGVIVELILLIGVVHVLAWTTPS